MTNENSLIPKMKELLFRRVVILTLLVLAALTFFFVTRGLPMVLNILVNFAIFAIITMSLNLESGYTGIPQFGRVLAVITGALAVGAIPGRLMALFMGLPWGVEYASNRINNQIVPQLNDVLAGSWLMSIGFLLLCILIAAVFGAGIGWLTSRPAIRLKEAYLGISLLAFGDFFMLVGHNWAPLVGGSTAVYVPDPFRIVPGNRFQAVAITIFVISMLIYFYLQKLTNSPFGRLLKMVRDNDVAASAAGKDVTKIRTQSLVIGSIIAAIAGGLYVIYSGTATSATFSRLNFTFWPWAFMMLGGVASNTGMLFGVMVLSIMRTAITVYRYQLFGFLAIWGINPIWLEFTLLGVVIVGVILFMPHGLVPERVEPILPASKVKAQISKGIGTKM